MARKKAKDDSKAIVLRGEVYQGNPLIQGRKEFDVLGMRIFLLGLRGVNPHFSEKDKTYDEQFEELFIPTAKLVELLGGNTWYLHDLEEYCKKFFDAKIHLRYEDGGFELMHIFRQLKYIPRVGLYVQFDELMRPYILDLFKSNGYTRIGVEQIFKLSTTGAVRLVELLLQYQNIASMKESRLIERTLTVEEVRFALDVPEDAYEGRMDNLRQRVLDAPIAEINSKTLYKVRYETVKEGRNVVAFRFFMDTSALPEDEPPATVFCDGILALQGLGFTQKSAQAIFLKCGTDKECVKRIAHAKSILEIQRKFVGVDNELGFLRKAIEENWDAPPKKERRLPYPPAQSKANSKSKSKSSSTAQKSAKPDSVIPQITVAVKFPKPEDFKGAEIPLNEPNAKAAVYLVNSGYTASAVKMYLTAHCLSLERFKELYVP